MEHRRPVAVQFPDGYQWTAAVVEGSLMNPHVADVPAEHLRAGRDPVPEVLSSLIA
jgi:hypothetical protein